MLPAPRALGHVSPDARWFSGIRRLVDDPESDFVLPSEWVPASVSVVPPSEVLGAATPPQAAKPTGTSSSQEKSKRIAHL
jgi:hypothetical protein